MYQTYVNAMNDKIRKQININNPFVFKHISNLKVGAAGGRWGRGLGPGRGRPQWGGDGVGGLRHGEGAPQWGPCLPCTPAASSSPEPALGFRGCHSEGRNAAAGVLVA